ncbi:hypothetical protein NGRA_1101 [Nosema granulosis]|uniref:Uncharacterized protein n=1 Tax=Nosema granulosis TaxID=83296 RepID=A0A9P6GZL1_9MICR|nr:hypothetical protein NGRA_1101 [Nosema granulosis]
MIWLILFYSYYIFGSMFTDGLGDSFNTECYEDMIDNNELIKFLEQILNEKTCSPKENIDQNYTNPLYIDEYQDMSFDEMKDYGTKNGINIENTTRHGVKRKHTSETNRNSERSSYITKQGRDFKINEYYKVTNMLVRVLNNMIDVFELETIDKIQFEKVYDINYIIKLDSIIAYTIESLKTGLIRHVAVPIEINDKFNIYADELVLFFNNNLDCTFNPTIVLMRMFRTKTFQASYRSLLQIISMEVHNSPDYFFKLNNVIVLAFMAHSTELDHNSFTNDKLNPENIFLFKMIIMLKVAKKLMSEGCYPNQELLINETIKKALIILVFERYTLVVDSNLNKIEKCPENKDPQNHFWFSFQCDYLYVLSYALEWKYKSLKNTLHVSRGCPDELRDNYLKLVDKASFYFEDLSKILLNQN